MNLPHNHTSRPVSLIESDTKEVRRDTPVVTSSSPVDGKSSESSDVVLFLSVRFIKGCERLNPGTSSLGNFMGLSFITTEIVRGKVGGWYKVSTLEFIMK